VGRIRTAWRRKRVRALTYLLALLTAVYVTARVVWDPPNDDGPLPTRGGITEVSRIEPLYTRIASELADREVEVRCWSDADWATRSEEVVSWTDGELRPGEWTAYVSWDHERANLAPAICRSLGRWAYERQWPDDRWEIFNFAWSVKVLAHESQHLRGIDNEATADCFGLQDMAAVGRGLGLGDEEARSVAEYAWVYIYPRGEGEYWSEECRDGGDLDRRPNTSTWP
jgi:hypothetical protein